jgi:hypothetical protein
VDRGSQSKGGLARLIATASLFVLTGVMLLPTGAVAETTGSIAGELTSAAGGAIEGKVCAISSGGEENCASTQPAGQYTISGLTSGEYKVSFTAVCVGKQCAVIYARLYYKDELSLARAAPVQVSAPATTTGIDASMETEGERKGREYLEDEVPAEPTGEATGVLPGAIEPLLVNKQIEEEFFAHPPWDQGPIPSRLSSTGAVATLVEGVAVAATTATVKHATAKIVLHCTGAGACGGSVKLVEGVTKKHFAKHDGKRVSVRHTRKLVIGTAGFSLRAGASETLHVHLTGIGRALLGRAGKKMLKVKLTGSGVKSGALILE